MAELNRNNRDARPDPDPTTLTTQQLDKAILCVREVLETRLNGMDTAIELLQTGTDKFSTFVKCEVRQLQELHEEKFASIETQFKERDTRTEQTSRDSKVAVDAALQAAKEAVGEQNKSNAASITKSEAAFTKQIDAIGVLINATTHGLNDKIDDIKNRLNSIEGRSKGMGDSWGYLVGAIGILLAVATLVTMILARN